jgi:hypothetical protein
MPIFIAALATVCVRFSRHTDAAPAERNTAAEGRAIIGTN